MSKSSSAKARTERRAKGLCTACGLSPTPCPCRYAANRKKGNRYSLLKSQARPRGLLVTLTRIRYMELIDLPCHWCGGPLAETGVGLDRLDNSIGYIEENVVPCCAHCNSIKSNFSVKEFLERIHRIALLHRRPV